MNSSEIITKCLDSSAYTNINHNMVLGLDGNLYEAFLLSHLMGMYTYFLNQGMLKEDGWFFQTVDDIATHCGITEAKQRTALSSLEGRGLIKSRLCGSPPKRHFKLDTDKIIGLFNPTYVVPVQSHPKSKIDFYLEVNKVISDPEYRILVLPLSSTGHEQWKHIQTVLENIPSDIGMFMWVWSSLYQGEFEWTSQQYGIIRTYWRNRYKYKKFDYNVELDYLQGVGGSIVDFIKYDREQIESKDKLTYEVVVNG